jgi:hypothetical protein
VPVHIASGITGVGLEPIRAAAEGVAHLRSSVPPELASRRL